MIMKKEFQNLYRNRYKIQVLYKGYKKLTPFNLSANSKNSMLNKAWRIRETRLEISPMTSNNLTNR